VVRPDSTTVWTPQNIYVTGSKGALGSGVASASVASQKPLASVQLNAVDDVVFGSDAFVQAINKAVDTGQTASINITRQTPSGVEPTASDLNRIFVTADTLTVRANGGV